MKKLLASLLAMVMALSLAAPAFADDTPPLADPGPGEEPPSGWTADAERSELAKRLGIPVEAEDYYLDDETWEWIAAHEEETKEYLSGGIDAHLQRMGYASIEDFCEGWATPEGATLILLKDWVWCQYDPAEDLTPPLWQSWGYNSYEDMLEFNGFTPREYGSMVSYAARFMETRPEETAQLRANAYDYFAQEYPDDTPQQYMVQWGHSEEDFLVEMTVWQILDVRAAEARQEWLDDFEASHPGMTAWFEANAYDYFAQEYDYWDSAEEYIKVCGYTEEEFVAEMVAEQIAILLYKEQQQAWLDQMKAELGGVPGQIGVMIDGEYVKFPDAAPELTNGRTMAPLRAVMEALGAEVTYNSNDDIRCTVNGVEYTFAVGSTAVKLRYVEWDGEGDAPDMEGLIMDCAPYIKNSRTYVPVRFFAEAFGYTVEWDGDFKTAVLTDYDKLAGEIDKDFTILNGLLAKRRLPDTYKASASCTGTLTIFNSIDGDQDSSMTVSQELTVSPAGMSGTVKYDLSGLLELLRAEYGAELLDETDEEQLAALKALLSGTVEVRMDQESGTLYLSMPALMEQLGVEAPKDAWFSTDAGELADKAALEDQSVTMGELLLLLTANTYYENDYPVFSYSNVRTTAKGVATLLGDQKFVRKGEASVLTLNAEDLAYLLADLEGDIGYSGGLAREFFLTLTVKDSGAAEYSLVYRTPASSYGADMRVTLSGSADGLNAEMKLELHVKNQYKLALTVKQTVAGTTEKPQTTPPEGATVIPMDGLPGALLPDSEPPHELPYPDGGAVPMEPAA